MEQVESFFFDTYAMHEILNKSKTYEKYSKNISIITSILNLMELHYIILRSHSKEEAEKAFNFFRKFCIDFDDAAIKEANELKLKFNRRDISYVDCIGYIMAKKTGVKFLTGDEQFKDMENVEFVK